MKFCKILLVISILAFTLSARAQMPEVTLEILDFPNTTTSTEISTTISSLINELNKAFIQNKTPQLKNLNIDKRTKQSILMLWENSPFRCDETEIVEPALQYGNEWQIRNIPFVFPSLENGDQYHEICINFDDSGLLTGFQMSISQNLYRKVIKNGASVKDARRRQMILDYVEQFRTAYNTKDLNFLNQVFSEDALIITGRVISVKPTLENNFVTSTTKYSVQDKMTYLNRLSGIFKRNRTIKVTFDDISVRMHPTDEDWYGVTLHQGWTAGAYHDDGFLFLLWDFSDEDHPTIHVRSWQADTNPFTKERLAEDEIFGLDDVNIVK